MMPKKTKNYTKNFLLLMAFPTSCQHCLKGWLYLYRTCIKFFDHVGNRHTYLTLTFDAEDIV